MESDSKVGFGFSRNLRGYFARAYKSDGKPRSADDLYNFACEQGTKLVKRKLLGLCGRTTIKDADNVVRVLLKTRVALNSDEAMELLSRLSKFCKQNPYSLNYGDSDFLIFEDVGESKYRVSVVHLSS